MVQTDPARLQARPASASLASSRGSTPERGTRIPSVGDGKDEDDWGYEGKSMTLRDILVRVGDATFAHFDILRERYLSFSLPLDYLHRPHRPRRWHIFPFERTDCIVCHPARCHAQMARLSNVFNRNCLTAIGSPRIPAHVAAGTPRISPFWFFWPRYFGFD
jgi:hypothetical protein